MSKQEHEHGHCCKGDHCHCHEHSRGLKYEFIIIAVTAILLVAVWIFTDANPNLNKWLVLGLFLVPYLVIGFHILREAAEKIFRGELLDESFLMSVASIGALCIGEYPEAIAVMLFYRIGECLRRRQKPPFGCGAYGHSPRLCLR